MLLEHTTQRACFLFNACTISHYIFMALQMAKPSPPFVPTLRGALVTMSYPSLDTVHTCNQVVPTSVPTLSLPVCPRCPYQCAHAVPTSVPTLSLPVCPRCPYQCAHAVPTSVSTLSLPVCPRCPTSVPTLSLPVCPHKTHQISIKLIK